MKKIGFTSLLLFCVLSYLGHLFKSDFEVRYASTWLSVFVPYLKFAVAAVIAFIFYIIAQFYMKMSKSKNRG